MSSAPAGRIADLIEAGRPFCVATVVAAGGASSDELPHGAAVPRVGAKLIVRDDGVLEGALGGTAPLQAAVARDAAAQLERETLLLARYGPDGGPLPARRFMRELDASTPFVEVSLDPFLPPCHLIIVGAGHIAVPLARFASLLSYRVTVIDDRQRFASRERFPTADELVVAPFGEAIASQTITSRTYIVLVTRGHEHDEATLQRVVGSPAPYIGMIGSRRRVALVFQRLIEQAVPDAFLDRIYAPIGLDIGARLPEEIALAIMAEIVNVRRGGRAASLALRQRRAPAHRAAGVTGSGAAGSSTAAVNV